MRNNFQSQSQTISLLLNRVILVSSSTESELGTEEVTSNRLKEEEEKRKGEGRWSEEEHGRFLEAYRLFGKNWKLIQRHIGTRSAAQARSHAQKYFRRLNRIKNLENTKEATPLCSPSFNPISEKTLKKARTKDKKGGKRALKLEGAKEIERKCTAEGLNSVSFENEVVENLGSLVDDELVLDPQMPLIMSIQYDPSVYSSWEKELDIENFKKRIASYRNAEELGEGGVDEERAGEESAEFQIFSRSRTLSSMFE
eukprot:TRINITY_DN1419_c0_g1_i1.p1 TRINITY_DN1419_c0_g1~~TRINITY_DN1419_c0_g1_i1.p1  ORF type:complete len:255 (+),score=56.55 TRINITY_DN1419_c0_g1_i1:45-809(+)